jgi:carboxymethylenebutenolidase
MSETVSISTLDGDGGFSAYCARPPGSPRAAIVVIQEIFGVNAGIRRKCDRLAEDGYLALAPDLFWRLEPGVELDPDIEAEFKQALELMGRFEQDRGVADIEATIRHARNALGSEQSRAKVGVVGYCLGGRLAYMVAARTDADASVGYYAVGLPELLREKHGIANPLMLHLAGADHFVQPEAQAAIHAGLDGHPKVTLHDYPGEDHGFATETGARRSEAAARLADSRTAAFFAEHLG